MQCIKCNKHVRKEDIIDVVFNIKDNGDIIGVFECPHCKHSFFIQAKCSTTYTPYNPERRQGEKWIN